MAAGPEWWPDHALTRQKMTGAAHLRKRHHEVLRLAVRERVPDWRARTVEPPGRVVPQEDPPTFDARGALSSNPMLSVSGVPLCSSEPQGAC